MPLFTYRAVQSDGTVAEGRLDAAGRQEAFRQLESKGLKALGLKEEAKASEKGGLLSFGRSSTKVSFKARENFTRQLSSLLAAGVPLSRAFHILCKEASQPTAKEQWNALHSMVVDGASLADSMGRFPENFPSVYVAMVHAGETGGFLDVVLAQIADFQTRERDLRSKVVAALIYPVLILFIAMGIIVYLMLVVIPRFQIIFESFGAPLPALTNAIIFVSEFLMKFGPFVAVGVFVAVVLGRRWVASENGRRIWQSWTLRVPVIGPLNAQFAMTRFCRMLGTLVEAGVPLINALRVAKESIGNQTLVDTVDSAIEKVKQGERLASSLANCPELFTSSVLEIISIGEETGRLDKELVRLAATTDDELDRGLRAAVSLAEPLLLLFMAIIVGTIVVSMILPIFSIQDYIK